MDNRAIGYIDSGIGGLSVVKEALEKLPNEQVYYVGDTARMPYGPREPEEVKKFTWQLVNFLMARNIKLLVIACNTATAAALPDLVNGLDIPVIGVIQPGVETASKATKTHEIGVLATQGTVNSMAYYNGLKSTNGNNDVYQLAAPKLVEIAEQPVKNPDTVQKIVNELLLPIKNQNIDTLVLGCTHFPLLASYIQKAVGPNIQLVDAGAAAVGVVSKILTDKNMQHEKTVHAYQSDEYYTTGSVQTFTQLAENWLELSELNVQHLNIENNQLLLENE